MYLEIERKFLVNDDSWKRSIKKSIPVKQAYLFSDNQTAVRVRIINGSAVISVKTKVNPETAKEFEYRIPESDARELITASKFGEIEKTRHNIDYAGRVWEIDEFEKKHKGLVIAEIELKNASETFEIPPWLGKEVTADITYANASLAKHPYPFLNDGFSERR